MSARARHWRESARRAASLAPTCPACGRGLDGSGCRPLAWLVAGARVPRIPYAGEAAGLPGPCPDCAVPAGSYHHPPCDQEPCIHGPQAMTCDRCELLEGAVH